VYVHLSILFEQTFYGQIFYGQIYISTNNAK